MQGGTTGEALCSNETKFYVLINLESKSLWLPLKDWNKQKTPKIFFLSTLDLMGKIIFHKHGHMSGQCMQGIFPITHCLKWNKVAGFFLCVYVMLFTIYVKLGKTPYLDLVFFFLISESYLL